MLFVVAVMIADGGNFRVAKLHVAVTVEVVVRVHVVVELQHSITGTGGTNYSGCCGLRLLSFFI